MPVFAFVLTVSSRNYHRSSQNLDQAKNWNGVEVFRRRDTKGLLCLADPQIQLTHSLAFELKEYSATWLAVSTIAVI